MTAVLDDAAFEGALAALPGCGRTADVSKILLDLSGTKMPISTNPCVYSRLTYFSLLPRFYLFSSLTANEINKNKYESSFKHIVCYPVINR